MFAIMVLGIIGFLLFSFLDSGIIESMHLTSIVVQPIRVNMIVTNNMIVQNAVRLNSKQESDAMQQQHAMLSQLQSQVDTFNAQQSAQFTAWK